MQRRVSIEGEEPLLLPSLSFLSIFLPQLVCFIKELFKKKKNKIEKSEREKECLVEWKR